MEYWNKRYSDGGKIWGIDPSITAEFALNLFKNYDIRSVLIPGSGYGRHTKYFSENDYSVTGIEISEIAVNIAKEFDEESDYILGSVLDMPFNEEKFDAVFCYNVLHLLLKNQRTLFIEKCYNQLSDRGFAFFAVFSDEEESFGRGKKIEENTFESKPYRPTHYYTEQDLLQEFYNFSITDTGIIEENENHGELGQHTHKLRYLFAKKSGK